MKSVGTCRSLTPLKKFLFSTWNVIQDFESTLTNYSEYWSNLWTQRKKDLLRQREALPFARVGGPTKPTALQPVCLPACLLAVGV